MIHHLVKIPIWGGVEAEIEIKQEYYTSQKLINPGLIACRHVIEHLQNPVTFLQIIRKQIKNNPLIFFETPRFEWILENNAFYDFFYEHCNYFTEESIRILFFRAGFDVIEIIPSFKNQYQLIFARPKKYNRNITDLQIKNDLEKFKNIAIWGAGAKGVTLCNMLDNVKCVIDINPNKQNCFIPKSGIPILSLKNAMLKYKLDLILVVNPNYLKEVKNMINDDKIMIISV